MQLKYLKTQCKKTPPFELLRRSVPIFLDEFTALFLDLPSNVPEST